jgi:polar amino acid transport system permease protein
VSTQHTLTTREDRALARQRRSRRHVAISGISTIVVLGGLAAWILTSSGWPDVRQSFFSSGVFDKAFGRVAAGFWLDVRMFLIVEACVLPIAMLIALCRTVSIPALFPLKLVCIVFVDVMRGIPTILLIFLVGFAVPALNLSGVPTSAIVLGCIALTMCYSAYVSEVFRAGIQSVHPSQAGAALALGLTPTQALRHVILPQAVRRVVPPLLNDFIALQKDVALVSILGVVEAFQFAQVYADQYFNFTPLIAAAVLYLCVTIPLTRMVDYLQARSRRERGSAMALGPR